MTVVTDVTLIVTSSVLSFFLGRGNGSNDDNDILRLRPL